MNVIPTSKANFFDSLKLSQLVLSIFNSHVMILLRMIQEQNKLNISHTFSLASPFPNTSFLCPAPSNTFQPTFVNSLDSSVFQESWQGTQAAYSSFDILLIMSIIYFDGRHSISLSVTFLISYSAEVFLQLLDTCFHSNSCIFRIRIILFARSS